MKETNFVYGEKRYRCFVAVSTEEYPHYYWCYLDDPELVKEIGDCVSYKMERGDSLQPSELYVEKYHDLIAVIRDRVVQPIAKAATLTSRG